MKCYRRGFLVVFAMLAICLFAGCRGAEDSEAPTSANQEPSDEVSKIGSALKTSKNSSERNSTGDQAQEHQIVFAEGDSPERRFTLDALKTKLEVHQVTVDDPLYKKEKTFQAFRLADIAKLGFERTSAQLADHAFVLTALDGYTVNIDGARLIEKGGFVAFDDVSHADGWEPIEERKADPAPLYLVWTGDQQREEKLYPRPWQLTEFSIADEQDNHTAAQPAHLDSDKPAWRGYELFRQECVACHSVNQSGGTVGPEFNIPKNITEYRSREFVLAFIANPATYRYSKMPSFEQLSDDDLDDIWSYLVAMKDRKIDPRHDNDPAP